MNIDATKKVFEWMKSKPENIDINSEFFCGTRDVFSARLEKMKNILIKKELFAQTAPLISAIAGEIGNNSFDHNLGNWPDVMGIFFAYNLNDNKCSIVLADRGLGVLKTLQRVSPDLKTHKQALETAFTKHISSRFPERRGNGLKFVKEVIKDKSYKLTFYSGDAKIIINKMFHLEDVKENHQGCLAIIMI